MGGVAKIKFLSNVIRLYKKNEEFFFFGGGGGGGRGGTVYIFEKFS